MSTIVHSRRTRWAATMVAGALALSAVACGTTGPGQAGAAGDVSMWALQTADQPILEETIGAWNDLHPDAAIRADFFSSDAYKPKIRTAVGAGQAPTLIYSWGGGVLRSYVEAGAVADLSAYRDRYPQLFERYVPVALENNQFDGRIYALPFNKVNPVVLYYNAELFTRAGVRPPTTWDELMALVPVFRGMGVAPLALGGQSKWPSLMYLEYLVDRIGGTEVFQRVLDRQPGAWSDPAVVEAATRIQQLVRAGGFADGFASTPSDSGSEMALLYTGRAAMVLQLSSQYQVVKKTAPEFVTGGRLGWVAFPAVSGGLGDPSYIVGTPANSFAISSASTEEQRRTALDFMAGQVLDESYVDAVVGSGGVPPIKDIESRLATSEDAGFLDFTYDLVQEASTFQLSWDQSLGVAEADALLTNLEQVFLLQISPEEFASRMDATL
jgi:raffinose/stachyose/melibiose transport system substrate-binding protein